MRKDPSKVTTFYLEVTPLTEATLQTISDYANEKGLKAELEVDGESHSLLEGDIKELAEKAGKAQRRGGLVRGYQY